MRKLFEINGKVCECRQTASGVPCDNCDFKYECNEADNSLCFYAYRSAYFDKRFEKVGTLMDADKIMEVINSVMVIPPAIQELIKNKLKEL